MSGIQKLNSLCTGVYKTTIKLQELELGKLYIVNEARRVQTEYGPRVILTLDDQYHVFLPARFGDISAELVEEMKQTCFRVYKINVHDLSEKKKIQFTPKNQ